MLALLWGSPAPAGAQQAPAVDPVTGIVHSQRLASGVSLGGLGTGTFQILTDGAISRATFNNNWNQPTGDLSGCFAALWTRVAGRASARALALKSAYGLPVIGALDYDGLYPVATLTYPDPNLPLAVTLRAFSPLVPFDLKNSSFPAAAFLFQLKNTSRVPVEVSVALSWENILGVGGTAARGPFHDRTGDRVTRLPDSEGYFGLKFTGPVVSGKVGDDLLRENAAGEYSLLAHPPRPEAVVTTAGWNALDARPGWWEEFAREGSVSGEAPMGREGKIHPAGVVAVRLTLKPDDYVVLPFAFAWHTPHYRTLSGTDYGHAYARIFPDSNRAARLLLAEWQSLLSLTQEWQNRLLFSDLPRWLVRRFINSAAPLTTNSLYTRAGNFTLLANIGTLSEGDAVAARDLGAFGALSDRLAVSRLLLAFFPELAAQELACYARTQSLTGAIPRSLGTLERPLDWQSPTEIRDSQPTPPDFLATRLHKRVFYDWPDNPESASAFAVQVAEYVLWTGDSPFLKQYYPHVRLALRAILQRGLDSAGLPEGASPATATLWLAALRAGQRLAELAGEEDFAKECQNAATRAAEGVRRRFWNGAFYATPGGGKTLPADGFCQTDQLWGEWAAGSLGLGPLLPPEEAGKALHSLQARNDRVRGMSFGPPYRVRPDGTLPPDDPEARRCRVVASTLAQAALYITQGQETAGVALLQRLENTRNNALRSPWETPAAFQADTGRSTMPGLAGMTGAADWNLLYALEGFTADLNAGRLSLAPNLPGTWRGLSAPLFAPTFWGTVTFRPTARGGELTLRVDRLIPLASAEPPDPKSSAASLVLKSLRVPGPPPRAESPVPDAPSAHVSLRRAPVGARAALDPTGAVIVTFESPVTLYAGDRLEIDVH